MKKARKHNIHNAIANIEEAIYQSWHWDYHTYTLLQIDPFLAKYIEELSPL